MANFTFKKIFLIFILYVCVCDLVNCFRLVQDKGKTEKPKKLNVIKKDEYLNETNFDITKKIKENLKYEPPEKSIIEKAQQILESKIIAKKKYVENETKSEKSTKTNITEILTKQEIEKQKPVVKIEEKPIEKNISKPKKDIYSSLEQKRHQKDKIEDKILELPDKIKSITAQISLNKNFTDEKDEKIFVESKKEHEKKLKESIKTFIKDAIEDKIHVKENETIKTDKVKKVSEVKKEEKKIIKEPIKNITTKVEIKLEKVRTDKPKDKDVEIVKKSKELDTKKTKQPAQEKIPIKEIKKPEKEVKEVKKTEKEVKKIPDTTKSDKKSSETDKEPILTRKPRDVPQTTYNIPSFYPDFRTVKNEECKKQGQIMMEHLSNGKLWAMRMFDSSAKIPSNILKGNLNQLGDYDQCIGIFTKVPDESKDNDLKISGKYCLAGIDIEATTQSMKLPVNLAQARAFIRSKNNDPGHFIPRFTTIQWGVCVPSSCTAEDVQATLENYVEKYNKTFSGVKFDILVDEEQCHIRRPPMKLDKMEYTTLVSVLIIASIIVTTIAATVRDIIANNDAKSKDMLEGIFMSFSLKQTTKSFLQDTESEEIKCIHGIRSICTLLLYIAHKIIPVGHTPFTNRVLLTEMSNSPLSIFLRLSLIYTDTFLMLSGILTAYHMSKDMETRGHIPWVNRIFARFLRLTPSLVIVLIYYAYIMEYMGEGPLWTTLIKENADLCKEHWWKNLIYIQNLYPFEEMCATHTHQLALDIQLFLFAPILVWFLYKRPFIGVVATIVLHALSVILRYYTTTNYRLSLIIYHGIPLSQLYRTANLLYASTLHRATPYIAGIGLGVLLRQMKPNFQIHKILSIFGWLVTAYFITWTFYMPSHLSQRTYLYDVSEAGQFAALCSLAWAMALSWIIFACYANYEGYLNTFLSCKPMILLSKLSYTIYLTQFIVFFYNVGTIKTSSEYDISSVANLSEFLMVITISTALFLVVDLPTQTIKRILMKPPVAKEKKPELNNTQVTPAEDSEEKTEDSEEKNDESE